MPLTVSSALGSSYHNLCIPVSNHLCLALKMTLPLLTLCNHERRGLLKSLNKLPLPAGPGTLRAGMGKGENVPSCSLSGRRAIQSLLTDVLRNPGAFLKCEPPSNHLRSFQSSHPFEVEQKQAMHEARQLFPRCTELTTADGSD